MPIFSISTLSKIYTNLGYWFENIPSGNPASTDPSQFKNADNKLRFYFYFQVFMVSEGVQTNGFNNGSRYSTCMHMYINGLTKDLQDCSHTYVPTQTYVNIKNLIIFCLCISKLEPMLWPLHLQPPARYGKTQCVCKVFVVLILYSVKPLIVGLVWIYPRSFQSTPPEFRESTIFRLISKVNRNPDDVLQMRSKLANWLNRK
jgi:hypothetical protein